MRDGRLETAATRARLMRSLCTVRRSSECSSCRLRRFCRRLARACAWSRLRTGKHGTSGGLETSNSFTADKSNSARARLCATTAPLPPGATEMIPNPTGRGKRSEAIILSALAQTGLSVLLPIGEERFDLVAYDGQPFTRIQCKTGRLRGGCVEFNTCVRDLRRPNGDGGYHGQIMRSACTARRTRLCTSCRSNACRVSP